MAADLPAEIKINLDELRGPIELSSKTVAGCAAAIREVDAVVLAVVHRLNEMKARLESGEIPVGNAEDLVADIKILEGQRQDMLMRLKTLTEDQKQLDSDFKTGLTAIVEVVKTKEKALADAMAAQEGRLIARLLALESTLASKTPPAEWLAGFSALLSAHGSLPSSAAPSAPRASLFPDDPSWKEVSVDIDPAGLSDSALKKRHTLDVPKDLSLKPDGFVLSPETVFQGLKLLRSYMEGHGGKAPYDIGPLLDPKALEILWASQHGVAKARPAVCGNTGLWMEAMKSFIDKQGLNADDMLTGIPKFKDFVGPKTKNLGQFKLGLDLHAVRTAVVYSCASSEARAATTTPSRFIMGYLSVVPGPLASAVKTALGIANANSVPKTITWSVLQATMLTELELLWASEGTNACAAFGIGDHHPSVTKATSSEIKSKGDKADPKSPNKSKTGTTLAAMLAAFASEAKADAPAKPKIEIKPEPKAESKAESTLAAVLAAIGVSQGATPGPKKKHGFQPKAHYRDRPGCPNCRDKSKPNHDIVDCHLPCQEYAAGNCTRGDKCRLSGTHRQ